MMPWVRIVFVSVLVPFAGCNTCTCTYINVGQGLDISHMAVHTCMKSVINIKVFQVCT